MKENSIKFTGLFQVETSVYVEIKDPSSRALILVYLPPMNLPTYRRENGKKAQCNAATEQFYT